MDPTSIVFSAAHGTPVNMVLYEGGHTHLVKTVLEQSSPLRLKLPNVAPEIVRAARRVMLLTQVDGLSLRADGHLDQIVRNEEGVFLEIGHVRWEQLERRRHARLPISLPVRLRLVVEGDEEDQPSFEACKGTTSDLSLSGAFVKVDNPPPLGTLVEFDANLDGQNVRLLAVVVHDSAPQRGVGLHFVEYLENARFQLHGYLARAA